LYLKYFNEDMPTPPGGGIRIPGDKNRPPININIPGIGPGGGITPIVIPIPGGGIFPIRPRPVNPVIPQPQPRPQPRPQPLPLPPPPPQGQPLPPTTFPQPYYRPINIYLCKWYEPERRTFMCYYTLAYADQLFPPGSPCTTFVAGPFYTFAECDEYIERNLGARRGEYYECN